MRVVSLCWWFYRKNSQWCETFPAKTCLSFSFRNRWFRWWVMMGESINTPLYSFLCFRGNRGEKPGEHGSSDSWLNPEVTWAHPSLRLPPPSHREFWLCWVLSLLETRAQSERYVTVINCSSIFLSLCPVTILIKQDKDQEMGVSGDQGERWFVGFW